MKTNFLTGLVILLPVIMTIIIIGFIINVLTNPFVSSVANIYDYYDIFNKPFLLMSSKQVLLLSSKITVLIGLVVMLFLAGFFGRMYFISHLGQFGEHLIHRIPLVNKIYKSIHEVVHTIFKPKNEELSSFSRVVLLPFPHSETLSFGLITNGDLPEASDSEHKDRISVFVPGTPNPAMGFMLMFRRDELIPTNMKVEEVLKFVISIGVICPDFTALKKPISEQDISAK